MLTVCWKRKRNSGKEVVEYTWTRWVGQKCEPDYICEEDWCFFCCNFPLCFPNSSFNTKLFSNRITLLSKGKHYHWNLYHRKQRNPDHRSLSPTIPTIAFDLTLNSGSHLILFLPHTTGCQWHGVSLLLHNGIKLCFHFFKDLKYKPP